MFLHWLRLFSAFLYIDLLSMSYSLKIKPSLKLI